MTKTIAVVGAGVAGITTAYYLVQAGFKVDLIDQEHYPAMQCSRANGGQVSVSNSEVWNTWSNILRGASWMFKKDAPLLIRPSLDWEKIKWLARFVYHTARNEHERNTARTIQMGLEARRLYQEIVEKEQLEFDQSNCGILHFYKNQKFQFKTEKMVLNMFEELTETASPEKVWETYFKEFKELMNDLS